MARSGTRADFTPPRFEEVFAAAVNIVRDRGMEIAMCEAPSGTLTTAPLDVDARCGGTTCLARETTHVKLGYRRAHVTLTREVWDPTLRVWREQDDPTTLDELSRKEHEIASRMVQGRGSSPALTDPCAPPPCVDGSCLARGAPNAPKN